jgi:hypothetical protein
MTGRALILTAGGAAAAYLLLRKLAAAPPPKLNPCTGLTGYALAACEGTKFLAPVLGNVVDNLKGYPGAVVDAVSFLNPLKGTSCYPGQTKYHVYRERNGATWKLPVSEYRGDTMYRLQALVKAYKVTDDVVCCGISTDPSFAALQRSLPSYAPPPSCSATTLTPDRLNSLWGRLT